MKGAELVSEHFWVFGMIEVKGDWVEFKDEGLFKRLIKSEKTKILHQAQDVLEVTPSVRVANSPTVRFHRNCTFFKLRQPFCSGTNVPRLSLDTGLLSDVFLSTISGNRPSIGTSFGNGILNLERRAC